MKPYERKDTFHTFRYRSGHITTCWNLDRKREEVSVLLGNGERRDCVSVHAAKITITRHIGQKAA